MHDHWNYAPGTKQQVYTFTNAHSVELLLNGKSLGRQDNTGTKSLTNVILWKDVEFGRGGTLTAIALDKQGKEVARHELQTAGKAKRLVAKPETTEWKADGMDLAYIESTAVDSKGRRDVTFNSITVNVEGAATFMTLDNGDHYTPDLFHGVSTKPMRNGRMQLILRSTRQQGNVTVTISAGGKKTKLKLVTKQ